MQAKLYGQSDVTTMSDTDYGIKIITISDDQIDFIVYGRIPLGSHMAHNGIVLYSYMMEGNSIMRGLEMCLCSLSNRSEIYAVQASKGMALRYCTSPNL